MAQGARLERRARPGSRRVRRKETFETGDVTSLSRGDERSKQALLLARRRGGGAATRDALSRAGHDLPCVRLGKPKDAPDVAVRIVERLPEDVGGSFGGGQCFQEHP